MLSTSPQKTQDVVLGKKPNVASDSYNIYDEELVDKLISGIGGLASIYHKTQGEWNKEQAKFNKTTTATDTEIKEEEVAEKKKSKPPKQKNAKSVLPEVESKANSGVTEIPNIVAQP
jgi:hypothetical protein